MDVEYASEFRYRDFLLDRTTLVIVVSQSGETADTLAALRATKDSARAVLAVTNAVSSSVAREADGVLYTHAGPEIGVAATKTFTAQMTALALVALGLRPRPGAGSAKKPASGSSRSSSASPTRSRRSSARPKRSRIWPSGSPGSPISSTSAAG